MGENSWEEDVFGKDALAPGESVRVAVKDGPRACKYDMRFEFQGEQYGCGHFGADEGTRTPTPFGTGT